MRKWFMMGIAAVLACGLSACGTVETVPTEEADYSMVFANQTGRNVSKVEIRASEEADWYEITLTENEWKNSFEIPVFLQGQIPVAEDGWQVQMTFVGNDAAVWEGITFADAQTITFSVDENGVTAAQVVTEETEEPLMDCDPESLTVDACVSDETEMEENGVIEE